MGRKPESDDEETSVFDAAEPRGEEVPGGHEASKRPKKETERGYDQATRQVKPPNAQLPFGTASDQIRLISMKTPDEVPKREVSVDPPSLKLRGISEFHSSTPPGGMGRLAPPRDEKEVRARRRKDLVMWTAAVLVIGGLVMTIVVLLARR